MNNRLYSYLYFYLKNIFTLKKSSAFANLLIEKPGNLFAIAKMWKKNPPEERNFKKRTASLLKNSL